MIMGRRLGPIKRDSLAEKIQNRILDMIQDGSLTPDEKIPSEREFCEEFQVSRTSMREALKGLISMGILEKRSDGTYVREKTTDIVREPLQALIRVGRIPMEKVSEARIAFECQMVRVAAQKAEEQDIQECRKLLQEIESCANQKTKIEKKAAFHYRIAEMTKNDLMIAMFSVVYDMLHQFRISDGGSGEEKTPGKVGHAEILECIARRDPDAAEQAMRLHLADVENRKYHFSE